MRSNVARAKDQFRCSAWPSRQSSSTDWGLRAMRAIELAPGAHWGKPPWTSSRVKWEPNLRAIDAAHTASPAGRDPPYPHARALTETSLVSCYNYAHAH